MFLFDFLVFYYGGKAVWAGLSPYGEGFISPYPLAVLFAPLALLPIPIAYALYLAFSIFLLWRLLRWRAIWALFTFPIIFSLYVGQIDLPLTLGIAAVPWLLPLAIIKPQVGFVIAPWLLRRFSRQDWIKAVITSICIMALSFLLRPGWVSEWMAVTPTTEYYMMRASNLYYIIPDQWIDLYMDLIYGLAIVSWVAAFFLKNKSVSWTITHLFNPLSNVYSAAVLVEWIGPLELAASYLAVVLTGGSIHMGLPMYLVGLVILARNLPILTFLKKTFLPKSAETR